MAMYANQFAGTGSDYQDDDQDQGSSASTGGSPQGQSSQDQGYDDDDDSSGDQSQGGGSQWSGQGDDGSSGGGGSASPDLSGMNRFNKGIATLAKYSGMQDDMDNAGRAGAVSAIQNRIADLSAQQDQLQPQGALARSSAQRFRDAASAEHAAQVHHQLYRDKALRYGLLGPDETEAKAILENLDPAGEQFAIIKALVDKHEKYLAHQKAQHDAFMRDPAGYAHQQSERLNEQAKLMGYSLFPGADAGWNPSGTVRGHASNIQAPVVDAHSYLRGEGPLPVAPPPPGHPQHPMAPSSHQQYSQAPQGHPGYQQYSQAPQGHPGYQQYSPAPQGHAQQYSAPAAPPQAGSHGNMYGPGAAEFASRMVSHHQGNPYAPGVTGAAAHAVSHQGNPYAPGVTNAASRAVSHPPAAPSPAQQGLPPASGGFSSYVRGSMEGTMDDLRDLAQQYAHPLDSSVAAMGTPPIAAVYHGVKSLGEGAGHAYAAWEAAHDPTRQQADPAVHAEEFRQHGRDSRNFNNAVLAAAAGGAAKGVRGRGGAVKGPAAAAARGEWTVGEGPHVADSRAGSAFAKGSPENLSHEAHTASGATGTATASSQPRSRTSGSSNPIAMSNSKPNPPKEAAPTGPKPNPTPPPNPNPKPTPSTKPAASAANAAASGVTKSVNDAHAKAVGVDPRKNGPVMLRDPKTGKEYPRRYHNETDPATGKKKRVYDHVEGGYTEQAKAVMDAANKIGPGKNVQPNQKLPVPGAKPTPPQKPPTESSAEVSASQPKPKPEPPEPKGGGDTAKYKEEEARQFRNQIRQQARKEANGARKEVNGAVKAKNAPAKAQDAGPVGKQLEALAFTGRLKAFAKRLKKAGAIPESSQGAKNPVAKAPSAVHEASKNKSIQDIIQNTQGTKPRIVEKGPVPGLTMKPKGTIPWDSSNDRWGPVSSSHANPAAEPLVPPHTNSTHAAKQKAKSTVEMPPEQPKPEAQPVRGLREAMGERAAKPPEATPPAKPPKKQAQAEAWHFRLNHQGEKIKVPGKRPPGAGSWKSELAGQDDARKAWAAKKKKDVQLVGDYVRRKREQIENAPSQNPASQRLQRDAKQAQKEDRRGVRSTPQKPKNIERLGYRPNNGGVA